MHKISPEIISSATDDSFFLLDKDTIRHYAVFRIVVQNKTEINEGSFLRILAGTGKSKSILLVADKNNNSDFSDDSIYKIDMHIPVTSPQHWFKRLPFIRIDSFKIYNHSGEKEYKSIQLKLGVGKLGDAYFETFEEFQNAGNYYLDIFITEYFSALVQRGDDHYEFGVALNPVTKDFLDYPGIMQGSNLILQYKVTNTKDTVINYLPVSELSRTSPSIKNLFLLGNDYFTIQSFSMKEKKLMLVETSPNHYTIPDRDHRGLAEFIKDKKHTLFYFGGSWCRPCKIIMPKLLQLYAGYKEKVEFITVAVENDPESAYYYHDKNGSKWKMVYENLNCNDVECLKNKLNVNGFPTLILIDRNRKIVFHEAGVQAIDELEQLLQKLF